MTNTNLNQRIGEALRLKFAEAGLEGCPEPRVLWGVRKQPNSFYDHMKSLGSQSVALLEQTEEWPDFCNDGNAMLLLIGAMRRLGWGFTLMCWAEVEYLATTYSKQGHYQADANALSLAVARAAAKALGIPE